MQTNIVAPIEYICKLGFQVAVIFQLCYGTQQMRIQVHTYKLTKAINYIMSNNINKIDSEYWAGIVIGLSHTSQVSATRPDIDQTRVR